MLVHSIISLAEMPNPALLHTSKAASKNKGVLAAISVRFRNLRDMAAELGQFQEFTGIGHSTIVRWLKREREGKELPRGAERAIALLSANRPVKVRIPYHDSPVALPIMILAALTAPNSQDKRTHSFEIEQIAVPSGVEALTRVSREEAEVAFAWEDVQLPKESQTNCAALCDYVRYNLEGILIESAQRPMVSRRELRRLKFGFPYTSAVGEFLKSEIDFEKARGLAPQALESEEAAAAALKRGEVDCLVGWQPWLNKAKASLRMPEQQIRDLPAGLLPPIRLALFVSKESKKGAAILDLLRSLSKVIINPSAALATLRPGQIANLADRIGIDPADFNPEQLLREIEKLFDYYDFRLTNTDLDVLFRIWREAEVATSS